MAERNLNTADVLTVRGVKTFEKRCDGCRHWVAPLGVMLAQGTCKLAVAEGQQLFYVRSDWGYEAYLFTSPEFCCSHWQEKEAGNV